MTGPGLSKDVAAVLSDLQNHGGFPLPPILMAPGDMSTHARRRPTTGGRGETPRGRNPDPRATPRGRRYEVAHKVTTTTPQMLSTSSAKICAARSLFEDHLEPRFRAALGAAPDANSVITPKLFQHKLFTKARADPRRVVLPEGEDPRVVAAAGELLERGLVQLTILGDPAVVAANAEAAGVAYQLASAEVIDPRACDEALFDESFSASVFSPRRRRDVSLCGVAATSLAAPPPRRFLGAAPPRRFLNAAPPRRRHGGDSPPPRREAVATQARGGVPRTPEAQGRGSRKSERARARRSQHLRRHDDEIREGGRHGLGRVPLDGRDDPGGEPKGCLHGRSDPVDITPQATMRPALQLLKTAPGFDIVSSARDLSGAGPAAASPRPARS